MLQENFQLTSPNLIGTHFSCKFSTTYARRNGYSKDIPGAKVASTLRIGRPVKYKVRVDFSNLINNNLILQLIGSNITNLFPRQAALVLDCMIFWAVFDKEISKIVQPNIVDRMKRQICAIDVRLESGRNNPTENFSSVVTSCEGYLLIDEIPEEHNPVVRGAGTFKHTAFLLTQISFCNFIFIFFILFYI